MRLGLIAAGEGSRLRNEGVIGPKGLVEVGGVPMAGRTIRAFATQGITGVKAIVNQESPELAEYLRSTDLGIPIEVVVQSTPSSMHSLFALAPLLREAPFFLATVDAVYNPSDLQSYIQRCGNVADVDGIIALTRYIDDEKPLYAALNDNERIIAMGDKAAHSDWITGGLYWFSPTIFDEMERAKELGLERLRKFQGLLIERDYQILGHKFGTIVDVDHKADIIKAEEWITKWNGVEV